MGNPGCPWGCGRLELEEHDIPPDRTSGKMLWARAKFYVCHGCNRHWPRSAVISRNTARDGVKPRGVSRL